MLFSTLPRWNSNAFCFRIQLDRFLWGVGDWGGGGGRWLVAGFRDNNSSKQRQIELTFWPQVVLIVVQRPFKGFWKAQIFTENFKVPTFLRFWSNFGSNLPPEDGQNAKIKNSHPITQINQNQGPISFQFLMKTIINFLSIWASLGTNGPSVKRSQLRLAPCFQMTL